MADRIGVDEARRKTSAGDALLVCGYEDDAKCARIRLDGAITLPELEARSATTSKDREIIFYCA